MHVKWCLAEWTWHSVGPGASPYVSSEKRYCTACIRFGVEVGKRSWLIFYRVTFLTTETCGSLETALCASSKTDFKGGKLASVRRLEFTWYKFQQVSIAIKKIIKKTACFCNTFRNPYIIDITKIIQRWKKFVSKGTLRVHLLHREIRVFEN